MSETMYEILIYTKHFGFTHNFIRLIMVLHENHRNLIKNQFYISKILKIRRYYNITKKIKSMKPKYNNTKKNL